MTREIPLTQGKVTLVDDADFDWLSQWKWRYHSTGYAIRRRQKADGPGSENIRMHRLILSPIPEGYEPDHIDGDGLNNQRANLRLATHSQNHANRGMQRNNTSGFKGVSWQKKRKKWEARIRVNGHNVYLGYFDDIIEAARAYNRAAVKHFGEFARLNDV